MGDLWLISSQSVPGNDASLAARYSAALARFKERTTTATSFTATPSCNSSEGLGGGASSVFDVIERAIGYGIEPPKPPDGFDGPPLVSYETTPGPYGDVVRATNAYVAWFRRTYCLEGGEDRLSQSRIGSPNKEMGGEDSGALVRGGRFKQNDLAP